MKFRGLIILLLTVFSQYAYGQRYLLTEESEVSILTVGPYQQELYSAFGHSGIRITDPNRRIDWVFHYGVFDFDQKNFYTNFALGKMMYQIGLAEWDPYIRYYLSEDRHLRLQYLNLTLEEKQKLFDFLLDNYQPENREYLYNYAFDNCATRIRDVIEDLFPQGIKFDTTYVEDGLTIRGLMDRCLGQQAWGDWMIDVGLGMQIDRVATPEEYMFLPEYIYEAFDEAVVVEAGAPRKMVTRMEEIHVPGTSSFEDTWLTPFNFFTILFFIVGFLTHLNMKRGKRSRWLDAFFFGLVGFIGIWLAFLWFGTAHLSKYNLNLLWAIPLHFPVVFLMRRKQLFGFLDRYFFWTGVFYGVLLLVWALLPQPLHMALVPFVLMLVLRAFYISYDYRVRAKQMQRVNGRAK